MFIQLLIANPTKVIFKGPVESVSLPGVEGSLQVLPNHAPLISQLGVGTIISNTKQERKTFLITSGFADVSNNKVVVLTPSVSTDR